MPVSVRGTAEVYRVRGVITSGLSALNPRKLGTCPQEAGRTRTRTRTRTREKAVSSGIGSWGEGDQGRLGAAGEPDRDPRGSAKPGGDVEPGRVAALWGNLGVHGQAAGPGPVDAAVGDQGA